MSSVGRIFRTYTGVDPAGPEEENEVPALESSDGVLAWARTEPEEVTEPEEAAESKDEAAESKDEAAESKDEAAESKDEAAESLEDGED